MDKVKVGIVGVGGMGNGHIGSVKNTPTMTLVAVCDTDREIADKRAKDNDVKAYYSADELLAAKVVDAIIIATPHYDHTTIAIKGFEAGVHVLSEKPIAVHKQDAKKMIAAHAKRPDLKFAAMFNQRTLEAHKKIKKLIDNNELGEIKRVNWIITNWFRSQAYYNSGGWRATWKGEGGGVLLNQCPHQLDLFQWFFGLPTEVTAFCDIGKYHDIEVEDDVTAYCRFANGATGVFITSTGETPGTNRLEIFADKGRLVFENDKITFKRTEVGVKEFCDTTDEAFGTPPIWEIEIPIPADTGVQHQKIIANFADAILNDTPLTAPGEEGIKSVEFGNSMLYSSMKNTTVKMPLDAEAYAEMLQELIANSKFVKTVKKADTSSFDNSFNN
jgi:predicted dehydrogenase